MKSITPPPLHWESLLRHYQVQPVRIDRHDITAANPGDVNADFVVPGHVGCSVAGAGVATLEGRDFTPSDDCISTYHLVCVTNVLRRPKGQPDNQPTSSAPIYLELSKIGTDPVAWTTRIPTRTGLDYQIAGLTGPILPQADGTPHPMITEGISMSLATLIAKKSTHPKNIPQDHI
ncbi:MAG: hypothetical protein M1813_007913 [Trichoglossum hirsutum]|nr:MAG: hypothetical protein M1813_007913 [Trichoglossum hirsutum]